MILDDDFIRGRELDVVESTAAAGVRLFQYRNKRGTRRQIFETAQKLVRAAHEFESMLIINDHADIAVAVNADGVHLGQDDLPLLTARIILGFPKLIGISTHSLEQAMAAMAYGADYIGFGPIFATRTKNAGPSRELDMLRRIRASIDIPILAIGGIGIENAASVVNAGADGVAVISAILQASSVSEASAEIITSISRRARKTKKAD